MRSQRQKSLPQALASVVLLAGVIQLTSVGCGPGRLEFGEPVDETRARSLSDVLRDPESIEGATVVVSGRIGEVCTTAGCWFVLQDVDHGKVYDLFTDLKGGATFTVPKSVRGRLAVVSGTLVGAKPDLKLNAIGLIVE